MANDTFRPQEDSMVDPAGQWSVLPAINPGNPPGGVPPPSTCADQLSMIITRINQAFAPNPPPAPWDSAVFHAHRCLLNQAHGNHLTTPEEPPANPNARQNVQNAFAGICVGGGPQSWGDFNAILSELDHGGPGGGVVPRKNAAFPKLPKAKKSP